MSIDEQVRNIANEEAYDMIGNFDFSDQIDSALEDFEGKIHDMATEAAEYFLENKEDDIAVEIVDLLVERPNPKFAALVRKIVVQEIVKIQEGSTDGLHIR